ncbi:lysyl endopeptidase [Actinosynnema sp. CS-041913]|uniref:lysyl endopeptidase n=1 Tax=Actinosynnema sp. CS-041913 TaxID=3239917 RepID=UPI003D8F9A8D
MRRTWFRSLPAVVTAAASVVAIGVAGQPGAAAAQSPPPTAGRSAIFGGGPFYSGGQAEMDTLRASGFTTVLLWSIHVMPNGDLNLNGTPVVSDGRYVGDPGWPARLRTLKQPPTSVTRIEVSVGSADVPDWENIEKLIAEQGTAPDSVLFRNFLALKTATGADAINSDDESNYDVASTVAFARMANLIGYRHFTLVPYTAAPYWKAVKQDLGPLVDRVYLQKYAGGSSNDPVRWSAELGMPVEPGLWSKHGNRCDQGDSPQQVESKMREWRDSANIPGGFMWLYDDIKKCSANGGPTAADYAQAINRATGPAVISSSP